MRIYLLDKKSGVFTNFKRFKLLVEKQVEYTIKRLRTDDGGEYTSIKFAQFCENEGIEHEIISSYTP